MAKQKQLTTPEKVGQLIYKLRTEAGISEQDLAGAANCTVKRLQEYEAGIKQPSNILLPRLDKALGAPGLEAEVAKLTAIDPVLLAEPANFHLRLLHLIKQVCEGSQHQFALAVGWPAATVSPLVNQQLKLSPTKAEQIFNKLPTLSREWLLNGTGAQWTGNPGSLAKKAPQNAGSKPLPPQPASPKAKQKGGVAAPPPPKEEVSTFTLWGAGQGEGTGQPQYLSLAAHPKKETQVKGKSPKLSFELSPEEEREQSFNIRPDRVNIIPGLSLADKLKGGKRAPIKLAEILGLLKQLTDAHCGLNEIQTAEVYKGLSVLFLN